VDLFHEHVGLFPFMIKTVSSSSPPLGTYLFFRMLHEARPFRFLKILLTASSSRCFFLFIDVFAFSSSGSFDIPGHSRNSAFLFFLFS